MMVAIVVAASAASAGDAVVTVYSNRFSAPQSPTFDDAGNLYFSDYV
ncbi:MAG: hypothetical protein LC708_02535 [Actinobacteria bacterium]|nr:hypothetical protein [Actinomycetota bacterium]